MDEDFYGLQGMTIWDVFTNSSSTELFFICKDFKKTKDVFILKMWHEGDCCEDVFLSDVDGDFNDLLCEEVLRVEIVKKEGTRLPNEEERYQDTETWTFYKIYTRKGSVTLRWYGTSNGYYSEEVSTKWFRTTNNIIF